MKNTELFQKILSDKTLSDVKALDHLTVGTIQRHIVLQM